MPAVPARHASSATRLATASRLRREVGGQLLRPAARQWRWRDFRRRRFRHGAGLRPFLPHGGDPFPIRNTDGSTVQVAQDPDHLSASPTTSARVHTIPLALLAGRRWMGHRRLRAVDHNPRGTGSPIAMGLNVAMSPTGRSGWRSSRVATAGSPTTSSATWRHWPHDRRSLWEPPVHSLSFRAISAGSFAVLLQPRERTVKGVSNTCHHGGAKPGGCRHPSTAALALDAVEPVDCAGGHGVHGGVFDGNGVGHRETAGQSVGAGMDLHNICTKTAQ